jgi:hypothetical protein
LELVKPIGIQIIVGFLCVLKKNKSRSYTKHIYSIKRQLEGLKGSIRPPPVESKE